MLNVYIRRTHARPGGLEKVLAKNSAGNSTSTGLRGNEAGNKSKRNDL